MAAKALADVILPEPAVKFDRGSPYSGHYLFKASSFGSRKSFTANKSGSTLVELRGDGAQTMIPPSVHPNGNKLSFTALNEAANAVEYADLLKTVNLLAACSEIAQSWRRRTSPWHKPFLRFLTSISPFLIFPNLRGNK